jgi:hypothetical protein
LHSGRDPPEISAETRFVVDVLWTNGREMPFNLCRRRATMFDLIARIVRSLLAQPQKQELLIRVPVQADKRSLYKRR